MAEAFKLYKLIILYMLDKVDFPLTNSQISEFILNEGYTTYFKLQQALSELLDSGFIREESTHTRTFYHLTEEGEETIHYFKNDISPAIQEDINSFLSNKQYELKNEVAIKADYYRNPNMEYCIITIFPVMFLQRFRSSYQLHIQVYQQEVPELPLPAILLQLQALRLL